MKARKKWLGSVAFALVLILVASAAQALTITSLKGQGLNDLYGTYAPGGDCQREPRVTVDDAGFTYAWRGKTVHSGTIEWAVAYMGQDYQGISHVAFPFPLSDDDYGRVLMTFNADEHVGVLKFDPNLGPGQSLNSLQAALVHASPFAKCGTHAADATPKAGTVAPSKGKINPDKGAVKPTPAQAAAIRRAASSDLAECTRTGTATPCPWPTSMMTGAPTCWSSTAMRPAFAGPRVAAA